MQQLRPPTLWINQEKFPTQLSTFVEWKPWDVVKALEKGEGKWRFCRIETSIFLQPRRASTDSQTIWQKNSEHTPEAHIKNCTFWPANRKLLSSKDSSLNFTVKSWQEIHSLCNLPQKKKQQVLTIIDINYSLIGSFKKLSWVRSLKWVWKAPLRLMMLDTFMNTQSDSCQLSFGIHVLQSSSRQWREKPDNRK